MLLKGADAARAIREAAARDAASLVRRRVEPCLVFVHPEGDAGAASYAASQRKACDAAGIAHRPVVLPAGTTQPDLLRRARELAADPSVTGILWHAPMPAPLDEKAARLVAGEDHDVEGLHPSTYGRLVLGDASLAPCTAAAARPGSTLPSKRSRASISMFTRGSTAIQPVNVKLGIRHNTPGTRHRSISGMIYAWASLKLRA